MDYLLKSGIELEIYGIELNGEIVAIYPKTFSETEILSEEENLGEQSTLVLLITSQENPVEPYSIEDIQYLVFNDTNASSVNTWIKEVSYDKAWLNGDVFGWYSLLFSLPCSPPREEVIEAVDDYIYFPDYERLIILLPVLPNCSRGGGATVGKTAIDTDDGQVFMSVIRLRSNSLPWLLE